MTLTTKAFVRRAVAAAGITAVLGTVAACGGGDGDKKAQPPGSPPTTQAALPTEPATPPTEQPPSGAPSAEQSSAAPSATASKPASPTGAPKTTRPASSPSRTTKPPTAGGGAGAEFQGTWYVPVRRGDGALGILTVSGGSMTLTAGSTKCTGTLSASASVVLSCPGITARGKALVSQGGNRLTLDWTEGESDQFVRTKPA